AGGELDLGGGLRPVERRLVPLAERALLRKQSNDFSGEGAEAMLGRPAGLKYGEQDAPTHDLGTQRMVEAIKHPLARDYVDAGHRSFVLVPDPQRASAEGRAGRAQAGVVGRDDPRVSVDLVDEALRRVGRP